MMVQNGEEDIGIEIVGEAVEVPLKKSAKSKGRVKEEETTAQAKRRCVSTACIACRRRKSKCDGNTPSCAACASVYGTECVYDPNSDHRRKGVYKKDIDRLKTRNSTLQTLVQAILNYPEDEVLELVRQMRSSDSLDDVAEGILARENGLEGEDDDGDSPFFDNFISAGGPNFATQLSGKMGELRLEDGSVRFIGGTSNLLYLGSDGDDSTYGTSASVDPYQQQENPYVSWTEVTDDSILVLHLIEMYFTWHYTYFTTLSKSLFFRDFYLGKPPGDVRRKTEYCTPLLVNAMLALGCHFTSWPAARADPELSSTAGDHFFKEAKRLLREDDEYERPKLATIQALALMSVREAGCGRESKGWAYSGMSFRMAYDIGLNLDSGGLSAGKESTLTEEEIDARRITFWGCFLFDKCWSNYLGRQPQFQLSSITAPKIDVFPEEDAADWRAYIDSGYTEVFKQPARTRAVALQISALCEISSDLLAFFYHPSQMDKPLGKQAELKKLSELHTRLEAWKKNLPKEMEPREGALPNVLLMHMFFQLLFIHLFRPFLKYNETTSPLPSHVSPRKLCTQAACLISKLLRLYKRTHGLRQICNVAVYIAHSACTIHLLNIPDKTAKRDIVHGVKQLEEISESWLCARRTLAILKLLAHRWKIDLPEEAAIVLTRAEKKFGAYGDHLSPRADSASPSASVHLVTPRMNYVSAPSSSEVNFATNMGGASGGSIIAAASLPDSSGVIVQPPNSASDLQKTFIGQQYAMTPQSTGSTQINPVSAGASAVASPASFVGSAESVVPRESRDWWLEDQQCLAMGFENWNNYSGNDLMDVNNNIPSDLTINRNRANDHRLSNLEGFMDGTWYN